MRKRFWKGLKPFEMVVILAVFAMILAVIAGRYEQFKCRAIESEAKFSLEEIYAAQKLFHETHHYYASIEKLLIEDKRVFLPQKYYIFTDVVPPTKDSFLVRATGMNGLVEGEEWSIDQKKRLSLVKDVCKSFKSL